ncbi:unnamed protein product [Effrenium voratum]|uniref:Uncharacterized protein n=1 Tax=Effrenium voratum TaxID=2562239 RepID=A0AA36NFW0_9DINO|nr:unnamed protein product [Effrenium voratum]
MDDQMRLQAQRALGLALTLAERLLDELFRGQPGPQGLPAALPAACRCCARCLPLLCPLCPPWCLPVSLASASQRALLPSHSLLAPVLALLLYLDVKVLVLVLLNMHLVQASTGPPAVAMLRHVLVGGPPQSHRRDHDRGRGARATSHEGFLDEDLVRRIMQEVSGGRSRVSLRTPAFGRLRLRVAREERGPAAIGEDLQAAQCLGKTIPCYGSDEETRLDDRSCRTSVSSREDSAQWSVDEMTTSSLALYRTRRFVSIPSDGDSIDDRRPPEECDRSRLRRAFFEESTCHW